MEKLPQDDQICQIDNSCSSTKKHKHSNQNDLLKKTPFRTAAIFLLLGLIIIEVTFQVYWSNKYSDFQQKCQIKNSDVIIYIKAFQRKMMEQLQLVTDDIVFSKNQNGQQNVESGQKDYQRAELSKLNINLKNVSNSIKNIQQKFAETARRKIFLLQNLMKAVEKKLKIIEAQQKRKSGQTNLTKDIIVPQTVSYTKLPLDLLHVNNKDQRVQDVLYPDEAMRKKRTQFHTQRIEFVDKKDKDLFKSLPLIKYNQIHDFSQYLLAQIEFNNDWQRLEDKFGLSNITDELPICIISTGHNNMANFRVEYNLNSIFTQNYTNYKAVIIDDGSNDGSQQIYRRYFEFYNIDPARYIYIENTKRITAVENIYIATYDHCRNDSIVVTLDADDQLIGRNTFKLFNWAYITKKSGVVYTTHIRYNQQKNYAELWETTDYTDQQKIKNIYRDVTPARFSQLRSYRAELFKQIAKKDLQDKDGKFYNITYDNAIFIPIIEMSCGKVDRIDGEYNYLYNVETGLNDYTNAKWQIQVDLRIRAQKKYQCYKPFLSKMKQTP